MHVYAPRLDYRVSFIIAALTSFLSQVWLLHVNWTHALTLRSCFEGVFELAVRRTVPLQDVAH